jgi:glycosyltransferase involved in cell wall biosynthesis
MRVLLVNDLAPGSGSGAEVTVDRLAQGLRDAGDEVHLFAGEVTHSGAGRALDIWDPFARRALVRRMAQVRPDVVHHHNVLRELSVSVLGAQRQVPCVLTVHDHRLVGDADGELTGALALVDRWVKRPIDLAVARRHVDATLAVSSDLAARLRAHGMRRVEVVDVPAGELGPEPAPPSGSSLVVTAGRLTRDKGVDVLLRAWRKVSAQRPEAELVIAGDGPEREALVALANALPCVRFTGALSPAEVRRLMLSARVVCVPSQPGVRREGTPLAAAEAALLGRALVVSDDPGLAALVAALGAGRVFPATDEDALVAELVELLADDGLSDREGAALRARAAERFATERVVEQVRRTYQAVIGG